MDPPNPAESPQQVITSLEHFLQIQAAEEAAAEAAAAAKGNTTADDFPNDPAEQRALIDQFVAAILNTDGIVDNYRHHPTENSEVKFVLGLPREKIVRKGWEFMDYDYKVQRGIIHPDAFCPELPNFMTRWRLTLCTFQKSKAACSDLFTLPYLWRYTCNPVCELETKVSNNHTNKMKEYRKPIDQARKFGGSYETVGNITTVRNPAGETIETLIKPQKRPLSEFLDNGLAAYAKVKRQRRVTGSSSTSGATSSSPAGNGNAAATQPVESVTGGVLATIQEELSDQRDYSHDDNFDEDEPAVEEEEHAFQDQFDVLQASNAFINAEPEVSRDHHTDQDAASVPQPLLNEQYVTSNYHPSQCPAPPTDLANDDLPIWDQQAQQPVDPMTYFNFNMYFERDNQPIAGDSGGSGGSQPVNSQESGTVSEPDN